MRYRREIVVGPAPDLVFGYLSDFVGERATTLERMGDAALDGLAARLAHAAR